MLHFENPRESNKNKSLMCFVSFINFWFYKLKGIILKSNGLINKHKFTQISETMFNITDHNLEKLKDILNDFENDQGALMIKLLFCLFVINYLIENRMQMKKNI